MTREEAIEVIKAKANYLESDKRFRAAVETIIPELRESEDERIRKKMIEHFKSKTKDTWCNMPVKSILAWLEKQGRCDIDCPQKYQDNIQPNGCIVLENFNGGEGFYKLNLDYLNKKQVEEVEEMVRTWNKESKVSNENIKACVGMCLTDANEQRFKDYNTSLKDCLDYLEKQKEYVSNNFDDVWDEEDCEEIIAEGQKLTPRFKELLKEVCHAWYDRGAKLEKQKEQNPAEWSEDWREEDIQTRFAFYTYKNEEDDGVLYLSNVFVEESSRNHGFGTKILAAAEKVAETIGATTISLKVKQDSPANAWYRKNGYGYVAFEDGYDWLEKNLEYMKPNKQEWSEEDKEMFGKVLECIRFAEDHYQLEKEETNGVSVKLWLLDHIIPQPKPEWSEEDEKLFWGLTAYIPNEELERLGVTRNDILKKLKSIRLQPTQLKEAYKEGFQTARHATALAFMNYLDENRPKGKMCLSNSECEDIEKAFLVGDWEKIERYFHKCQWKPSEHQMNILKAVKDYVGKGSGYWGEGVGSLIDDLEKLM